MPVTNDTHEHYVVKRTHASATLEERKPKDNYPRTVRGNTDIQILLMKIMRQRSLTQYDLAKALDLTQPTISRLLSGAEAKYVNREKILQYAREQGVLRTDQEGALQYAPGVVIVAVIDHQGELRRLTEEEQEIAPRPPGAASASMVAARVIGGAMAPMMDDGWVIYWDAEGHEPADELIGRLCVTTLIGGRQLVRKLERNRKPGKYDLHALNAPTLRALSLEAASRVLWIQPK